MKAMQIKAVITAEGGVQEQATGMLLSEQRGK